MTKTFSFFYSRGTAAYVRGEQMADYLGAKKNPVSGFENDICIYVKILPPDNPPKYTYCDVDDSIKSANYLKSHPEIKVIANSQNAKEYLENSLKRDDIVVIPHAHCNYERWKRPNRKIKNIGIIGSITSFQYPVDKIEKELQNIGLTLSYEKNYWDNYKSTPDRPGRLKVCDFYKTIDIQIVWRPRMMYSYFKNPNKLVNAGSFGIPTIAYPEEGFKEWNGYFKEVSLIDEMLGTIEFLKDAQLTYSNLSENVYKKAEFNHIEHISKLYQQL